MKILVVTYPVPRLLAMYLEKHIFDKVIVVDKALKEVVDKNISFDILIGDLDSIEKTDTSNFEIIKLEEKKDVTDTFFAVEYALEFLPDEVHLLGGLNGPRVDHLIANLNLMASFNDVIIVDDFNELVRYEVGDHRITESHQYISFFAIVPSLISLKGFKYALNRYSLKPYDSLVVSNEIISNGFLTVHNGAVIGIKSSDK